MPPQIHAQSYDEGRTPAGGGTPHGLRRGSGDDDCRGADLSVLVRAVETEVIPRLLTVHKTPPRTRRLPKLDDVEALAALAMQSRTAEAMLLIDRLRDDGIGIESIYLNLLAATARMLGEMWEHDRIGFVDVTVGLCTLHQILFRLTPDGEDPEGGSRRRSAIFVPVPGETHIFGALIVARFFSRAGWRTWTEIGAGKEALVELMADAEFDLIGLSISCTRHVDTLAETIAAVKAVSPGIAVLVGGHAADITPDLADRVGADSQAPDPIAAVEIAEALVDRAAANA